MIENKLYLMAEYDGDTQKLITGWYDAIRGVGIAGKQTMGIPYHVTLGTFEVSEEARAVELMERILPGTGEISLRINHIGMFGPGLLFVEPNANIQLFSLIRAFFPGECSGSHMFAPHTTVIMDEPENTRRALMKLFEVFTPAEGRLVAVSLYQFPDSRFIKRLRLTGM